MNNLAVILKQVIEARKLSTEQPVVDQIDQVIQTILDMMNAEPKSDLPPINYGVPIPAPGDDSRFDSIWRTPIGGYRILCAVDTGITECDNAVSGSANALAEKILGGR